MSSLSALATDNTAPHVTPPPRSMRLSDAEKIAAERLDSASISSLKAALAGVTAAAAPPAGPPRLVERIDAAAKLAADATAAAEAVERLKHLLQAQLATSRTSTPAEPTSARRESVPPASSASALASAPPLAEQPRPDVR